MAALTKEFYDMESRLVSGVICGAAGGLMMAVFVMIYFAIQPGTDAFFFPNLAATLTGATMHDGFSSSTWIGIGVHVVTSICLGAAWAIAMPGVKNNKAALLAGLFFSFVVYFAMFYIILPVLSLPLALTGRSLGVFLAHLVYGLAFALYPKLIHRLYPHLHHKS